MQKCYVCKSNRRQLLMLTCSHDVCIKCAADNYFLNTVGKKEQRKDEKKAKRESYFCEICLQVTKIDEGTINELKQWYISNVNAKSVTKTNSTNRNGVSGTKQGSRQQEKRQRERQRQRRQQQKQRQRRQQQRQRQSNRQRQRQKQRQSNPKHHPNNYPSNTYHQNNFRLQNQYQQRINYQLQQSNNNRNNRQQKSNKQMPEEYQVRGLLRYREEGRQERGDGNMGDYRNTVKRNSNNFNNNNYQQRNGQPQRHSYKPTHHYTSLQYPQPRPTTRSNTTRIFGSIVKRDQLKHNQNLKNVITQAKDQQRQRINSYKSEQKLSNYHEPSYRPKKVNTETDQQSEVTSRDGVIMRPISKRAREGREAGRGMESGYRGEGEGNCNNRRKQVYLDLIGNEHSLEQQQQQYQSQSQYHQYQQHTPIASTKDYSPSPKPQPINKFSSTQSTYHHTTNTNPLTTKSPLTNPTPARKIHCNIHQDQQIIYYCLQCKLLICSQCALYGQHKDHNIHTLKKAAFKLKETLYGLISEINAYLLVEEQREQVLMEQIKEIKIQSNKQKQKVKFAFQNFIKNVQNKYSQVLQQLQQSQLKSLSNYNLQLQKCKLKCTQYFERKNSMKNLFQTFAKNPTNNQLAAPYLQSGKNLVASTNVGSNQQKDVGTNNNRVYRQFDDFFQENSMTSEQRNFFNTNIEELQAKISDYEDYVRKIKVEYQRFVYPNAFGQNGLNGNNSQSGTKRHSGSKQGNNNNTSASKPGTLSNMPPGSFHRPQNKASRQSIQLHQSLRLSQTSLLIQPSSFQSPQKNNSPPNDQFLCHQDFIQQNNLQSLNLMIQKQLTNSELSQLKENLKLAHVDTIIQSIKQIQQIIKQFSIEYRSYMMKVGKRV